MDKLVLVEEGNITPLCRKLPRQHVGAWLLFSTLRRKLRSANELDGLKVPGFSFVPLESLSHVVQALC